MAAAALLGALMRGAVVVRNALEEEASLRRAAQQQQEELKREAEELRGREQVRRDLAQFRRLTEERQFYTPSTTPAGDRPLLDDSQRSHDAGEKPLAGADQLT